jgi:hypothetical protein
MDNADSLPFRKGTGDVDRDIIFLNGVLVQWPIGGR